jgi:voltage-gated potassium channel
MKKLKNSLIALFAYLLLLMVLVQSEKDMDEGSIKNIYDAIWYSIVTLSTVGYGDFYPVSALGKIIGLVFVFSSLGVLGYFISQLTVKLTKYMENKKNGLFGTKMENHIVIIGYNKFGKHILEQIVASGVKVAIVTKNKEDIESIASNFKKGDVFVFLSDLEKFEDLEKVNITKASKVFLNFEDDTEMLVYILDLKNHYKDIEIIVSLNNASFKKTFRSAGVLYAVAREDIAAKLVASYIFEPEVAALTEDLMASASKKDDFDLIELKVSKNNPYLNKEYEFAFVDIRKKYSSVLLGIYKDEILYKNPIEPITILENDYLVIMTNGENEPILEADFEVAQGRF